MERVPGLEKVSLISRSTDSTIVTRLLQLILRNKGAARWSRGHAVYDNLHLPSCVHEAMSRSFSALFCFVVFLARPNTVLAGVLKRGKGWNYLG